MGIRWQGITEFEKVLEQTPDRVERAVAKTLFQEAEKIMTVSKGRFVPVDEGTLRASGHVDRPQIGPSRISVTLGYGGAASAYALIQHEAMNFAHTVGGPKYLERPVMAAAGQVSRAVGVAVEKAL